MPYNSKNQQQLHILMNNTLAAWPHKMPYNDFILAVLNDGQKANVINSPLIKTVHKSCINKSPQQIVAKLNRQMAKARKPISPRFKATEKYYAQEIAGLLVKLVAYLNIAFNQVYYKTYMDETKVQPKVQAILEKGSA